MRPGFQTSLAIAPVAASNSLSEILRYAQNDKESAFRDTQTHTGSVIPVTGIIDAGYNRSTGRANGGWIFYGTLSWVLR